MNKEQWIKQHVALYMAKSNTNHDEQTVRAYLNYICKDAENEDLSPDEKIFLNWMSLATTDFVINMFS